MAIMFRGDKNNSAQQTDIANTRIFAGTTLGYKTSFSDDPLKNGCARPVERILVGDKDGIAREVYTRYEGTHYQVSSIEEFVEKANADPYGYFELTYGKYSLSNWLQYNYYNTKDHYVMNFYGVLDGQASRLIGGAPNGNFVPYFILNNYGTIKRLRCYNASLLYKNYGRVTECYFKQIDAQRYCYPMDTLEKYGLVDNCLISQWSSSLPDYSHQYSRAGLCMNIADGTRGRIHNCLAVTKVDCSKTATPFVATYGQVNSEYNGTRNECFMRNNYALVSLSEYSYPSKYIQETRLVTETFKNATGTYLQMHKYWDKEKLLGLNFEKTWAFQAYNGNLGTVYLKGMGTIESLSKN